MARTRGPKRRKANHTDVVLVAQGKGLVKRTQNHPYDSAGSDDVEYQVREIKAHRKCYGVDQYLVGWEGLATQHDTWEPVENLPGSEDAITAFCKEQAEKAAESEAREAGNKRKRLSTARSAPNADGDERDDAPGMKRRKTPLHYLRAGPLRCVCVRITII